MAVRRPMILAASVKFAPFELAQGTGTLVVGAWEAYIIPPIQSGFTLMCTAIGCYLVVLTQRILTLAVADCEYTCGGRDESQQNETHG